MKIPGGFLVQPSKNLKTAKMSLEDQAELKKKTVQYIHKVLVTLN